MRIAKFLVAATAGLWVAAASTNGVAQAPAAEPMVVGIVAFTSGPGAAAAGVPARNGAELVLEAINAGKLPAPYNSVGFGGVKAEAVIVDESGGNAKQITEFRNLVQRRNAKVVVGYISSGSCLAIAPVAEELQALTVFATCGTPRIFEEGAKKYVFRSMGHTTSDGVAAARYLLEKFPGTAQFTGINQNYAFGTDAWQEFTTAVSTLVPNAKASDKAQWPKFLAGQYGTEISALLLDPSPLVYSSFWGGDLEAFVLQAAARGAFAEKKIMISVGGDAYDRVGKRMPDGAIIGVRGPYGILVRDRDTPLNKWFIEQYYNRYGTYPLSGSYEYAQAVLALKAGYDKAQKAAGRFPTTDEVAAAMKGMEFESLASKVKFALGGGHQAVTENGFGVTKYDHVADKPNVVDVKFYPPECLFPPDGVKSEVWLKDGLKGAKC